jgi:hypothetical protein
MKTEITRRAWQPPAWASASELANVAEEHEPLLLACGLLEEARPALVALATRQLPHEDDLDVGRRKETFARVDAVLTRAKAAFVAARAQAAIDDDHAALVEEAFHRAVDVARDARLSDADAIALVDVADDAEALAQSLERVLGVRAQRAPISRRIAAIRALAPRIAELAGARPSDVQAAEADWDELEQEVGAALAAAARVVSLPPRQVARAAPGAADAGIVAIEERRARRARAGRRQAERARRRAHAARRSGCRGRGSAGRAPRLGGSGRAGVRGAARVRRKSEP